MEQGIITGESETFLLLLLLILPHTHSPRELVSAVRAARRDDGLSCLVVQVEHPLLPSPFRVWHLFSCYSPDIESGPVRGTIFDYDEECTGIGW